MAKDTCIHVLHILSNENKDAMLVSNDDSRQQSLVSNDDLATQEMQDLFDKLAANANANNKKDDDLLRALVGEVLRLLVCGDKQGAIRVLKMVLRYLQPVLAYKRSGFVLSRL